MFFNCKKIRKIINVFCPLVEADVMSQFHVPYISAVATNPYLRTVDTTSLLLMAPSDKYQSQVGLG